MERPTKRTPLRKEHVEGENMERSAFLKSIKGMAEEMELKRASWGECARRKNVGPAGPFNSPM